MKRILVTTIFITMLFGFGFFSARDNYARIRDVIADGLSKESTAAFDVQISENFRFRNKWINLNGLMQKCIGKTADLEKDWYRMKNGQMIYSTRKISDDKLSEYADNVSELAEYVSNRGADFYFVQLPFKVNEDSVMPPGVTEYAPVNAGKLKDKLKGKGVDVFDLETRVKTLNRSRDKLFFDTDQHWKPATALWAAEQIYSYVGSQDDSWKYDNSKFNKDNFNIKTYKNWFLGSIGKKTGNWYAGVDDFDVIWPKYDTDYDFKASSASGRIRRSGSFRKVMFKKSNLKKDYFDINTYASYIGGDFKVNKITNKLTDNKKKVLILRDSFSCALLPFMTLDCEEVTTVDLRHYKKMSVMDFIEAHDPDIVMICYNPSAFTDEQFCFNSVYRK